MSKVPVVFTETRVVDDERKGTEAEERYEAGKTYRLDAASAHHWIRRGYAKQTKASRKAAQRKQAAAGTGGTRAAKAKPAVTKGA